MKIVESFTSFTNLKNLKKWAFNKIKNSYEGFNSPEDAKDYLNWFFETDFPDGISNIPNEVILYRYLNVKFKKNINFEKLGTHFLSNFKNMNMNYFFMMIDVINDNNLYLVTIKTSKENINLKETIENRINFPDEYEWTLYDNYKYEIVDIKKEDTHYS